MRLLLILFLLAQQTPTVSPGNGTVTGVLRTSDGKPAQGVRVAAMAALDSSDATLKGAEMVSLGVTDAKGRYQLDNVPPGRYYITAGRLDAPTYFPGTLEFSSGRVVALTSSSEMTDVNFVLKDESQGRAAVSDLMFFTILRPGLTVPMAVSAVSVEGAGKVPIFSNGISPVLRLTEVSTGKIYEELFSSSTVTLPIPVGTTVDEYRVSVDGLPDGFSLRSIKFGISDVQKDALKFSRAGLVMGQSRIQAQPGETALTQTVLSVVLAGSLSAQQGRGARVSGSSFGNGGEIYISNVPGTLYSDGTFEFRDVPRGLHTIVKSDGGSATVASIFVGSRDVEGVRMQNTPVLPVDILSKEPEIAAGKVPEAGTLSLATFTGRVVDEVLADGMKKPLTEGTITFSGYGELRRQYAIDSEGRFEITQLLPGKYKLAIHVRGYMDETRDITIGIEDLKLDLTAQREAH